MSAQGEQSPKMSSDFEDPRAEAFIRRAMLTAELRGESGINAERMARQAVKNGANISTEVLVDEDVRNAVRRIVAFLGRCYDEEIVFEFEGQSLSADQVWTDVAFVFGGGSTEEDTYQAILEVVATVAGR